MTGIFFGMTGVFFGITAFLQRAKPYFFPTTTVSFRTERSGVKNLPVVGCSFAIKLSVDNELLVGGRFLP